jgi:mannose-6-phosphate isomerase-like protein (cupin superfamily)
MAMDMHMDIHGQVSMDSLGHAYLSDMASEAPLERTEHGHVCRGDGWFVVNARDIRWYESEGWGKFSNFGGDTQFRRLGIGLTVLGPGEPMSMYHWESDQEDFLVLAGTATLVVEGQERELRQWDFVHCPAYTPHTIVGGRASSSRSAPATGTSNSGRTAASAAARARARTPSTRLRFDTVPASSARRRMQERRMRASRRARRRATAAGSTRDTRAR